MKKNNVKLHPFEFIGAYKLFTEERFLLADEMGMFKTAQTIFANNKFREKNRKLRTLIVCPTSVREHWARELQRWAYPTGKINLVYADNLEKSIKDVKNVDWTILSYSLMSRLENGLTQRLKETGFHHIIADEVHNAKNPDALRTRAIKSLTDQADYVSLLSGTPIPNTMSDLYVLMSMLDPQQYPFDPEKDSNDEDNFKIARQSFIQLYIERPQAVKELLHRKMLRRNVNDYLKDHIPEVEMHRIEIPLSGKHLEVYKKTVEEEMNVGKKIMDLAKASLDPCLVEEILAEERNGHGEISNKYQVLDEIVRKEMTKRNGKVLIFTNLKEGVVDYLTEKFNSFGAIRITGDVVTEGGVRENLRQKFQRDPSTRILIATTTMNEGVDLTAATAVVDLTIPYTPAERQQRWKRSYRPGEIKKDKVDIHTLCTTVSGPQSSLDKALLDMLDGKERIVSYLLQGMQISLEELRSYDQPERIPRIVRAITSPSKAVFGYFIKWRGIGADNARRRIQKNPDISKFIAELYPNFSMARNAADVYIPIIKRIEKEKGSNLKDKVDIGCGPGMLGFFLDESTRGIDINPDMILKGKELYPRNSLYESSMDKLPINDNSSDLTVCSLAFQMTEPKIERAKSLYEMSRVLRQKGYAIITLPGGYLDSNNLKNFKQVANEYGFKLRQTQKEAGRSRIDVYVFQKTNPVKSVKSYSLKWKGDLRRRK